MQREISTRKPQCAARTCRPRVTGTKEWADKNINIATGCEHACKYCYARSFAKRFGRIHDNSEWGTSYLGVKHSEVAKRRRNYGKNVMYPTSHDITPRLLEPSVTVLRKLLVAGNHVLVVSKPHLPCIERLCAEFAGDKDQILFRFTIGAMDDAILGYWEPRAPGFAERFECLKHAHEAGFRTSVSSEPMLDSANIVKLFRTLAPYVTDSIWIGKMNRVRSRVQPEAEAELLAVQRIEDGQTDDKIRTIYQELKDEPLVKWKESIKEIVGLPPAQQAGLDE